MHALDRALDVVHAAQVGVALAVREGAVRVPHKHGVNACHIGHVVGGVFHRGAVGAVVDAAMHHGDHDIGALAAHFRHIFLGGFLHAFNIDLAIQPLLVPHHDGRRGEADHADLDLLAAEGALKNHIRRVELLFVGGFVHVGADQRELRPLAAGVFGVPVGVVGDLAEIVEAIVELVVTHSHRVVLQVIHRLEDRVCLITLQRINRGLIIAQRRTLEGVAVVEQQGVGVVLANLRNDGRRALQADGLVFGGLEVVVAEDVGMQVGGFRQGDGDLGADGGGAGCGINKDSIITATTIKQETG